jgi:hypothetical protein
MQTRSQSQRSDAGSALILTLMVMALITGLATTVAVVTINNLQSSVKAQSAGSALNAADAGVAQAMAYLRAEGVRDLNCAPSCTSNPWGNSTTPMAVTLGGVASQGYRAWIEPVAPYPANDPALYRIHSTGTAAKSAARSVTVEVGVTSTDLPLGIFARTFSGGGDASVARESIFSTGCVYNREKIEMAPGLDLAYGIPVGVHSSQIITESNGSGQFCPTTNSPIHRSGNQNQNPRPCSTDYPYDQDKLGGSLLSTTCASTQTTYPGKYGPQDLDGVSGNEVEGSFIKDEATLLSLFGLRTPVLSQIQVDQLRATASLQGNLMYTANPPSPAGVWDPGKGGTIRHAVLFFDLQGSELGSTVDLNKIINYGRAANISATDASCQSKSLVIVIVGGNARLNSTQDLFASLFLTSSAPYGQLTKSNGTSNFIGTIFADNVHLVGTTDLSLDTCFMANLSPALLGLSAENYREEDRGLN